MPVQQIRRNERWPSGDSRALLVLRFSPDEMAARYGLRFEAGYDSLDYFQRAVIQLPDGSQARLIRHRGNPEPGTVVDIDLGANFAQAKRQVERVLELDPSDITWVSPFVAHPEQKPAPPRQRRAG